VTVIAGVLYLILVSLGGYFIVREQCTDIFGPADIFVCRLLTPFVLFFFAFGVLDLLFSGRWMTFPNAIVAAMTFIAVGRIFGWRRWLRALARAEGATPRLSLAALSPTVRLVAATVASGFVVVATLLVIGFPHGHEVNAYHLPSAVNFSRGGALQIWDTW
jgi:hypothetical protein